MILRTYFDIVMTSKKSLSLSLASLKCALSTVSKQIVADFLCKCLTGESFYLAHTWCTLCTGPEHWEVPNENFMVRSSYMIYIYDIYIMLQKSTKIVLSARGVRHPTWFNSMLFEFCKKMIHSIFDSLLIYVKFNSKYYSFVKKNLLIQFKR